MELFDAQHRDIEWMYPSRNTLDEMVLQMKIVEQMRVSK
jgi:hypothetical protein